MCSKCVGFGNISNIHISYDYTSFYDVYFHSDPHAYMSTRTYTNVSIYMYVFHIISIDLD